MDEAGGRGVSEPVSEFSVDAYGDVLIQDGIFLQRRSWTWAQEFCRWFHEQSAHLPVYEVTEERE